MKNTIKRIYKNWRKNRIIKHYHRVGQTYGDMISYTFLGEPDGLNWAEKSFKRAEKLYVDLGYEPVPIKAWVDYGGYGKPLGDLWLKVKTAVPLP